MIEVLKQRKKKITNDNLKFINSWFDNDIVKLQKKTSKWLFKFSYKEIINSNKKFSKKEKIDYNNFIDYANSSFTLITTKWKNIYKDLRLVKKFNKMLKDFALQESIYTTIISIDDFYNLVNKKDVENKKIEAIKIGNEYILKIYDVFKKEYLIAFKDDEILQQKVQLVFDNDIITDAKLFLPITSIQALFKFIKISLKNNKIEKEEFNKLFMNSVFISYYINGYISIYQHFIDSLV